MELTDEHPMLASIQCLDEAAGSGSLSFCVLSLDGADEPLGDSTAANGSQCQEHVNFDFASGGLQRLTKVLLQCPSCVVEGAPGSWMEGVEIKTRRDSLVRSRTQAWRTRIRSRSYGMLMREIREKLI